jgi:hypothetical protein
MRRGNLPPDQNQQCPEKYHRAQQIPQVECHADGIASRFAERRRQNLYCPETDGDFGHFYAAIPGDQDAASRAAACDGWAP